VCQISLSGNKELDRQNIAERGVPTLKHWVGGKAKTQRKGLFPLRFFAFFFSGDTKPEII